jgi:hypothetical protein
MGIERGIASAIYRHLKTCDSVRSEGLLWLRWVWYPRETSYINIKYVELQHSVKPRYTDTCLICFRLRIIWNKEMGVLFEHRVSTVLQNTHSGRFKQIRRDWNWMGLKLTGTLQLLICGDHANLLSENIHAVRNIKALLVASKRIDLEGNA